MPMMSCMMPMRTLAIVIVPDLGIIKVRNPSLIRHFSTLYVQAKALNWKRYARADDPIVPPTINPMFEMASLIIIIDDLGSLGCRCVDFVKVVPDAV
jgi:hypothetical protein